MLLRDKAVAQVNLSYTPLENDKIYFLVENLTLKLELWNSHVRQKLSLYLCTRAASCDPLRAPRFARRRRSPSFKWKSRAISNNAMYQKKHLKVVDLSWDNNTTSTLRCGGRGCSSDVEGRWPGRQRLRFDFEAGFHEGVSRGVYLFRKPNFQLSHILAWLIFSCPPIGQECEFSVVGIKVDLFSYKNCVFG